MKSFLRGMKNVGRFLTAPQTLGVLGVVSKLAPIPGVGFAMSLIQTAARVEARHIDDKEQAGVQKAADFMEDFLDGVASANVVLAQKGKRLVVDEVKLAAARDAVINALNLCREAQDSTEIVDLSD
jgi:hypothetical protein